MSDHPTTCPNCGVDLPKIPGMPRTPQEKLAYLDEIIQGFNDRKMTAVTRGVIYLIQKERSELAWRIENGVEK